MNGVRKAQVRRISEEGLNVAFLSPEKTAVMVQ